MASPQATKKIEHLKARLKGLGKHTLSGWKGSAVSGGTGVAVGAAYGWARENVDYVKKNPRQTGYVVGGAAVLAGHMLKKKQRDAGSGAIGAGGLLIGLQFFANSNEDKKAEADKAALAGVAPGAKGLDGGNAGALVDPGAGWSGMPDAGDIEGNNATEANRGTSAYGASGLDGGNAGAVIDPDSAGWDDVMGLEA